jgi:hypothetical protein
MNKRDFLKQTALIAGAGLATNLLPGGAWLAQAQSDETGPYTLPKLPYSFDALEPHLDKLTMEIHHDRHHQQDTNKHSTITVTDIAIAVTVTITTIDIAKAVEENAKITLDRHAIELDKPIKTTGKHEVNVKLHSGVTCFLKITVVAEGEAAPADEADSEE